jgi:protein-tyrosine phosphatase
MPGRHETFAEFLSEAERVDLDLVVCLASEREIRSKSPAYSAARSARAMPFSIRDFPIEDHGVPSEDEVPAFEELVAHISSELREGKVVLIHCWMGIGRTGTVATCVLLEIGLEPAAALHLVRKAGSGGEVSAQKNLIAWYSSRPPKI